MWLHFLTRPCAYLHIYSHLILCVLVLESVSNKSHVCMCISASLSILLNFTIFLLLFCNVQLTYICLVDPSILINRTCPVPILGVAGVHFHFILFQTDIPVCKQWRPWSDAAFDLGLHCFPMSHKWEARLICLMFATDLKWKDWTNTMISHPFSIISVTHKPALIQLLGQPQTHCRPIQ